MTFSDVFKSSFLEQASSFSIVDTFLAMMLSFSIGLFIFIVYRKTFSGVMYSASFGVSLIALAMVTTLVILAVTSNVILSLGMVGALSIVRFRTAIKEPLDIAFLFWSIALGIVIGAGLFPLAVMGSIFIGIMLLIFATKKATDTPYILLVNFNEENQEKEIIKIINENVKKSLLKAKTMSEFGTELTIEVRLKKEDSTLINSINNIAGVSNVTLVTYNGEYMS